VQPVIEGSVEDILVDSQDFDINQVLSISVTGGNASGGSFEPILVRRRREILFDGRSTSRWWWSERTDYLTINFLNRSQSYLMVRRVTYRNNGNPDISIGIGLSSLINNSSYYVKVDNSTTVQTIQIIW
jgi:hypothetical protein